MTIKLTVTQGRTSMTSGAQRLPSEIAGADAPEVDDLAGTDTASGQDLQRNGACR